MDGDDSFVESLVKCSFAFKMIIMLAGMLNLNGNVLHSLMVLELVLNLPQGFE